MLLFTCRPTQNCICNNLCYSVRPCGPHPSHAQPGTVLLAVIVLLNSNINNLRCLHAFDSNQIRNIYHTAIKKAKRGFQFNIYAFAAQQKYYQNLDTIATPTNNLSKPRPTRDSRGYLVRDRGTQKLSMFGYLLTSLMENIR